MEEAFILLYQEFQVLQAKCRKQAELLQKLLEQKGISNKLPFSKPIQCTDDGDSSGSESPFFRLHEKKEVCAALSNPPEAVLCQSVPLTSKDLDFDIKFPPDVENYSFLASEAEKVAWDLSQLDLTLDKKGRNSELELFIKHYTPQFPNGISSADKRAPHSTIKGLDFLDPISSNQNLSLSNLYEEDLCYLQSKDISFGDSLEPENKNPLGIRGPAQPSWSPGCLSEECQLGHPMDMNSDVRISSQICDFCQAVFPAGAATKGEYLRHLTGHVE
ncbi:TRAF family member-associated NF-kappa-B activator [Bombina bombina]|uniref:TRAF family member-associated NF-kappa-B activator n=1 Tax=Bombina bombina TaxID=8345 RepID=UPI00235A9C39|nr:TRAF family member-associated NF-kappa-B activator [Bombina bombina]